MLYTVSIDEILELNRLLEKTGFKAGFCDACGGQSFKIKKLSDDGNIEEFEKIIREFFAAKGAECRLDIKNGFFTVVKGNNG